jgi:hypothetical protein
MSKDGRGSSEAFLVGEVGLVKQVVERGKELCLSPATKALIGVLLTEKDDDFDLCGRGWRAYDIASYLLVIRGSAEEEASQQAFLKGYEEIRPLREIEGETLPPPSPITHHASTHTHQLSRITSPASTLPHHIMPCGCASALR